MVKSLEALYADEKALTAQYQDRALKAESELSTLHQQNAVLSAEVEGLRGDKGRFEWWFSKASDALRLKILTDEISDVADWDVDRWRSVIDAAIAQEPKP